jgi:hypothetical protein
MSYAEWKARVLGRRIGDGECVSLVVNNSEAYVESLFPGVSWPSIIPPVYAAKDMAGKSTMYLTWIFNDHNNPNQLPKQGDIMVFGATPSAGYTNTFNNPYGHAGVCDSADAGGYNLLQQNSPAYRNPANITRFAWRFRPCLGWLTPVKTPTPAPPTAPPSVQTVFLPASAGPWHAYAPGSSYNPNDRSAVRGILRPDLYPPGLTYPIRGWVGNVAVAIDTQYFGRVVIWVQGTVARIT